jgi:hypothetical protein
MSRLPPIVLHTTRDADRSGAAIVLGESRRMAGLKVRGSLSYVHEGRSLSIVTKLLLEHFAAFLGVDS